MKEITGALEKELRTKQVCSEMEYVSPECANGDQSGHDTILTLNEGVEGKVKTRRHKGREKATQAKASHLDGLNWEVLVVDKPVVNAFCLPSGKIVVFTGLLEHFKSDDELATIIGHEVAHAVARHSAETLTKNIWIAIVQLIIHQFISDLSIDTSNTISKFLLKLPFSRKMEMEADYIGLLLIAAAGFDPRVAPTVYKKLGKLSGNKTSKLEDYLSTHPSGKKRAESLAKAKVMGDAIRIFKEIRAGRGDEGF
ncbi:hypothetical protein SLEP1_g26974 [Rubroshorea leprosula]|uniref:Peptidase M48 domain-containing protein n=1 Tax=Rubroshorea leprosula TaxID=152421 RepID=A0AAV5JZL2_9ROSI|nr:hypothetical protein SLEP1_g26974 [Rubroshorea leprosula]